MIAASAVLVVVAFVTLILGIFQSGLGLIWVSIASSVLAAIFLLLGVVQTRPKVAVAGGSPQPSGPGSSPWAPSGAGPAVMDRPEPEAPAEPEVAPTAVMPRAEPAPSARASASRAPASRAPAKKPAAGEASVVVIPDRDKFHKESCRYAKSAAAMTMTKAAARKEGYKACGICKP